MQQQAAVQAQISKDLTVVIDNLWHTDQQSVHNVKPIMCGKL